MWNIMPQFSALTTTVLDFTHDLSPLIVGLIGLTWLSAGMIAVMAIQHYREQRDIPTEKKADPPIDHQDAA